MDSVASITSSLEPKEPVTTLCPLDTAIRYRNSEVILRFVDEYRVPPDYAEEVFEETLKWLWLLASSFEEGVEAHLAIYPIIGAIDEMWHTFLLYTEDYEEFCSHYLGRFIHHVPTKQEDKKDHKNRLAIDPDEIKSETRARLEHFLRYVSVRLGDETVTKWFGDREMFSMRHLLSYKASGNPDRFWEDRISHRVSHWTQSGIINFDSTVVEKHFDPRDSKRILNIGYANFSDALAFASRGASVIGIDLSRVGTATYRRCSESLKLDSHILGIQEDIQTVSLLPLGKFELVLCSMMLHVLSPEGRFRVISKLLGSLLPGGKLIVTAISKEDKYLACADEGLGMEELESYAMAHSATTTELAVEYVSHSHRHGNGEEHEGHHVVQGVFQM